MIRAEAAAAATNALDRQASSLLETTATAMLAGVSLTRQASRSSSDAPRNQRNLGHGWKRLHQLHRRGDRGLRASKSPSRISDSAADLVPQRLETSPGRYDRRDCRPPSWSGGLDYVGTAADSGPRLFAAGTKEPSTRAPG